jgi:hypothetical protein
MTQTNHTPGPWAFRMTGWQTNPAAIYSPRRPGAVACIPARTSVPLDEQSANARLIAAAPDLLAALVWAVETADTEQYEADWYAAARAAIAKAKGE